MQEECKFGVNCYRPDCRYKHPEKTHKNIPCIHFQGKKGCLKGDHCPYKHVLKTSQLVTNTPSKDVPSIPVQYTIPSEISLPRKRVTPETLEIPDFFTQDIMKILEEHESEVLKKPKLSPHQDKNTEI